MGTPAECMGEDIRPKVSGSSSWIESLLQDVRYGLRILRKNPGFTLVAVLTLALGIGSTTAIFTVVDRVLLRPFDAPEPDRIVFLIQTFENGSGDVISVPKYMMWRDQPQILEQTSIFSFPSSLRVNLIGNDQPEQLKATRVSANYFSLYGIRLVAGRTFSAEEDAPGGPPVVVISSGLWKGRFGSAPNIVGKAVNLDGTLHTVIGVMAPIYAADLPIGDMCLPIQADPNSNDQGNDLVSGARLKPGVTLAQAQAASRVIGEQFRKKYPNSMGPKQGFSVERRQDVLVKGVRPALLLLLGAVSFVLLIACANVANLQLARATLRKRELSIRAALGAGRGRIARQILTESALLGVIGGVIGVYLGFFGVRALLALNVGGSDVGPGTIVRVGQNASGIQMDWRILLFGLAISILSGVLAGLIPAIKASRGELGSAIKEVVARSGGGFRNNKTRSILAVVEMGLAMILLAGAALLIRTFHDSLTVNPGYQTHNILTMNMSLRGERFDKTAAVTEVVIGGWRSISPGYFEALGIPLLRGRAFTDRDDGPAEPVVVINEKMAKQYWPKGDEIGARMTIGGFGGAAFEDPPREVVGVVGNVRDGGLNYDPFPTMYVPQAQMNDILTKLDASLVPVQWMIRTKVEPHSLASQVSRELGNASGGLPVGTIESMDEVVAHSLAVQKFNMTLLTIFAGVALLLASIGIYGIMAYSVQQRTSEIGLRMALGASPQNVRWMIVGHGMALALIGVALGVAGGLAVTRVMRSLLFGVKPWDPTVFAVTAIILCAIALLACYVPAVRASRVDPMVALRYE